MKKQYYYHITEEDWGQETILHPKSDGSNRDPDEPKTPRICVTDTIEEPI